MPRNFLLNNELKMARKIREAILSVRIDANDCAESANRSCALVND